MFERTVAMLLCAVLGACGGGGGGGDSSSSSTAASGTSSGGTTVDVVPAAAPPTTQEQQCYGLGWRREVVSAAGLARLVLWKAPPSGWARGALVVMHGGGGTHTNYCVANVEQIAAQVRFTQLALDRGFAVFLLDSSDVVTDSQDRLCGKVWDDERRTRPNLDLPYIERVVRSLIPSLRPASGRPEIYMTGHSSGGYMTVRAVSALGDAITAFAPVASGDPYGWFRDCTRRPGDRANVAGAGFDNETRKQIIEPLACESTAGYPNEQPWDESPGRARPPFRVLHHAQDGINDASCVAKVRAQLIARGHPETPPFRLEGGDRSADAHAWQDAYGAPMLDFFAAQRSAP